MNTDRTAQTDGAGDNNEPIPPGFVDCPGGNNQMLRDNGWLCGFRVNDMDEPQVSAHQVASYVEGATPLVQEVNDISTEIITTHSQRAANYVHHGWSVSAVETISPWTLPRIDAANRQNAEGAWITRRTLARRLRVQVLLEDLAPVPEFVTAIEEALAKSATYERFQDVYRALSRWGDVVPLEMEMGSSLSLTDSETNFNQLPTMDSYNNLNLLSKIRTANIIRKGPANNIGWDDGTWIWNAIDMPATEWRPIRILTVAPIFMLLADDIQTRLADLHNERLSYVPPLAIDPINWPCTIHYDTINASRTISKVGIRCGNYIISLSVTYLDGVTSRGGGDTHIEHTFNLANGEHIVEMLTSTDGQWIRGIQFITNNGRCSAIYGWLEGVPTISRSEGGVLAGLLISTKQDNVHRLVTGVNGIWRHDVIPKAPKDKDVYSDYFGGKVQHGKGFNDRAIIGNSNSMYISSVEVRAQGDIHSIEFTYTDTRNGKVCKVKTPRHGGSHGPCYRFDLENGEHIVSVTGKYSDHYLRQLCFGTNLGRTSDVYGTGDGQSFSARAPLGEDRRILRLQYILGKCEVGLIGIMFAWTPGLP
ncbi:unnamed protein product [Rhizoctonia solani]|uniref:Jacalin-type lectin domain-containing protein n=1 Tax=Rhizoctonia solani TaxID=456999 RepID=A0A8H2W5K9_9AGAM|nr:unnamed protein product [Rhizoctonia solani]